MTVEKYHFHTREVAFSVLQTRMESIRTKDIIKTGYRVFENGLIGVAGVLGTCGETEENRLIEKAREKLFLEIEYPYPPSANLSRTIDMTREIVPRERLFSEITALLSDLKKRQPDFSFANQVSQAWIERDLVNDRGLDLHYRDHTMMVGLTFKEKTSANIMDGCVGYVSRRYDRAEYLAMADNICDAFSRQLDPLPAGRYPVIFDEESSPVLGKFITDLYGRTFATGGSVFSGKRGQKLFSERFSLEQYQDSTRNLVPFFDAEGVVNENYRYTLIDAGRIICPYTDKRTAATYDLPHTGSASAAYDQVPHAACYPLRAGCSGKTLKELLGGGTGIYIQMAEGGDFTPDGSFATPVQVAFLCDGERLVGRLPQFQISSHLFDMFGDRFRGRSSDILHPLSDSHTLVIEMNVSGI